MRKPDDAIKQFADFLQEGFDPFKTKALRNSEGRVKQVLEAFCYMVDNGINPPPLVMQFIAEGARQRIEDKKPWQRDNTKAIDPHVVALVQLINERYPGKHADMAEHTNMSERTIRLYVAEKSPDIGLHMGIYRAMYRKSNMAEMLEALSKMRPRRKNHESE